MNYKDILKNKPILKSELKRSDFASKEDKLHIMKLWRIGKKDSFENVLKNFDIKLTRFEKLVLKSKMSDNYNNIKGVK